MLLDTISVFKVVRVFESEMAREKTLSSKFSIINKDEIEVCVQRDFAALNEKLEMELGICKEVMKRLVGRPKKEMEAMLLTLKVEPNEQASKKARVRGPYSNWFLRAL